VSYYLTQREIDHVVLDKNSIAHSWKSERWDSFCLVTPNWQCRLPGFPYQGPDPDGFMLKDEIVGYVEAYAKSFGAPVEEGVAVTRIRLSEVGPGFEVSTSEGTLSADQVVIAAGAYHRPLIPPIGDHLPASIVQLHSRDYRNPESLPEGATLVVGSGQSGCQIAEDLHFAGRQVHLAVGTAPRSPRVYRAKDVVSWLEEMGYYDLPIDKHPKKDTVRTKTNHYVTGRNGGNEIDLRKHALDGMKLHGKLSNIQDGIIEFKDDLKANLDHADEVSESIKRSVDKYIADNGIDAPKEAPYDPVWQPAQTSEPLDCEAAGVTSVIWSTGFGMDFSWVEVPIFNGNGYPGHERGVTAVQGLYFLGLPWLYTWGSGRFSHVGQDALFVADTIVANLRREQPQATEGVNIVALGS
jgi:putative flavoprotein involved in K+ transport